MAINLRSPYYVEIRYDNGLLFLKTIYMGNA